LTTSQQEVAAGNDGGDDEAGQGGSVRMQGMTFVIPLGPGQLLTTERLVAVPR